VKFNLLPASILVLFLIGTAAAFQPSPGETPAADHTISGSPKTVKYLIEFPPRGADGTFPQDHNLVITTRLENPHWSWSLILDGVKNPNKTVTTEQLTLNGSELNHPGSVQQTVVVFLDGTAPEVSRVTMTSVIDIRETDTAGTIIPNASRSDSQIPIYPRVTTPQAPVPTTSSKNPAVGSVLLKPVAPALTLPQLAWLRETFQTAQVTLLPKGDITAGMPVTVSYRKNFPRSGSRTFPLDHELFFVSELNNPQWSYSIILGGNENPRVPRGGRALAVSGFELSYPCDRYEDLVVTVRGTAPSTGTVSEKTVLMVSEKDSAGDVVAGSTVVKTATIIPAQG
jgi:hypothetical protein